MLLSCYTCRFVLLPVRHNYYMNNIYLNNNNYLIVQSNEYAIISCDDLSKCNLFVQFCQYD